MNDQELAIERSWQHGYREGLRDVASTLYTLRSRLNAGLMTPEDFNVALDRIVEDYS